MVRKLSFRREKYALWDGPKFNMIQRSDKKVKVLTIPSLGFGLNRYKMTFSNVVTFWSTTQSYCIYFYPFWLWNSWFCNFFLIFLVFVLMRELEPDKIRYLYSPSLHPWLCVLTHIIIIRVKYYFGLYTLIKICFLFLNFKKNSFLIPKLCKNSFSMV